ncbi:hypothetical protein AWC20_06165 [Mycobacterium parmense]|nr:hypothetical protein AWC20_06165 [Mycobacterium parmense]
MVALVVFLVPVVTGVVDPGSLDQKSAVVVASSCLVFGASAAVIGGVARRRVKRGVAAGGGLAVAGLALGLLAVVSPVVLLAFVGFDVHAGYEAFRACVRGSGASYPSYLCLKECPDVLESLCRKAVGW